MKRRFAIYSLMVLLVGLPGVQLGSANCDYAELLTTHLSRSKRMIMNIVAAMPEEKWDFRPVPEVRSFREIAHHLVDDGIAHAGWAAGRTREESAKLAAKYEKLHTKAEILQGLEEMFAQAEKDLSTLTDQNARELVVGMRSEAHTRFEAAMVAFEDIMGHYGNMVVYLRLNGVVPPSTANAPQERQQNQERNRELGLPAPGQQPAQGGDQHGDHQH